MQHSCTVCGRFFDSNRSHARYCSSTCRGKAMKARKAASNEPTPIGVVAQTVVASLPGPSSPPAGPADLVSAVTTQLEKAAKLDTYAGQQALVLANRLQRSMLDTGSAVASLSKELDRLMVRLMSDFTEEPDAIDQARAAVVQLRTGSRRRG